jgi:hypothetical protein
MKQFIINEEEKMRILEMHETATKSHYLSEQQAPNKSYVVRVYDDIVKAVAGPGTDTDAVLEALQQIQTKEDLKISTKEGILKIIYEKQEGDKTRHFVGSFVKSYNIPDDVKEKDIVGKVENGILEITLPIDKKKSLERLISLN